MIVIGAQGHAKEVLEILKQNNTKEQLFFFDNVTLPEVPKLYEEFTILHSFDEIKKQLKNNPKFVSGIGNPKARMTLANKFIELGGKFESIIARNALISSFGVAIGEGCNIMQNAFISNSVIIGKGCLINYSASIHHDVSIGNFCDVGPNASILGRAQIGNYVSIGAGAIILPRVIVEDNAVIGAGALVNKNVQKGKTVAGNPAKVI